MRLLRNLLLPFVPLYYLITWSRNRLYDWRILKSTEFATPTIVVGNLSVGGTGKSPMVEYMIRLLKDDMHLATLSRGYKRSTSGYRLANENDSAKTIGDEPFQFYSKFNDILVAVDADRVNGIKQLLSNHNKPGLIILDDAFQHRKVKGGLNVLLTSYGDLYSNDILLPTGSLREPRSGAKRADVVVVTKCPDRLKDSERSAIKKSLRLSSSQPLVFSKIVYDSQLLNNHQESFKLSNLREKKVVLVTGIANPEPLVKYIEDQNVILEKHLAYPDHHDFSENELKQLKRLEKDYFLLTTEKDFVRLKDEISSLHYISIRTEFLAEDGKVFDTVIKKYLEEVRKHL
ncbi:tetraacyldisaccharide 4'-kinase [Spongiivirga sp. MCCC 1A20706]|uniref:tetraacyldisaccharide 4'-kinase n=1 Tax=Spongiivirga sp. MCCC 1A20706 TaxID=3160963 RepID=UPI0039772960